MAKLTERQKQVAKQLKQEQKEIDKAFAKQIKDRQNADRRRQQKKESNSVEDN